MEVFDAVESVVLAEWDFRFTLMFYPIVTWIHFCRDRTFGWHMAWDFMVLLFTCGSEIWES